MNASRRRYTLLGVLTLVFLTVGTAPSFAADGGGGGLLDPLDVTTSDGAPISRYELSSSGGGPIEVVRGFLMSGCFALARTLTGFCCWLIDWAYRFPVLEKLAGPAQTIADAYESEVLGPLGMAGTFLAWSFAFGLILIMRGRVARGAGEILLTLLIAALAASTLIRPAMLLGYDGPVQQTQRAALEAASLTANGGDKAKGADPCDLITGPGNKYCRQTTQDSGASQAAKKKARAQACDAVAGPARETCLSGERPLAAADVSKPITRTLTDTLVVQPYMLLQYGQVLDKNGPLYKVHKRDVNPPPAKDLADKKCADVVDGPAKDHCEDVHSQYYVSGEMGELGEEGKQAVAFSKKATWERCLGALLILVVTLIITVVVLAMVLALFAAQFGCVIAAAGAIVVFTWAMLPGPNRQALWKWVGIYASACLVLFGVAVFIPLFGVAARALLADNSTPMMERLFTLVGLAITALAGHRFMLRKSAGLGRRFADRMRYASIGGSHTMGDQAAATAAAMSSLGYSGAAGSSPAHQSFLSRHRGLTSGLRALGDATGLPGHPGALLAEARAEGRRALAPLAIGAGAAHTALIGPRTRHTSRPGARGTGAAAPTVIDGRTGRIISRPEQEFTPIGSRLEAGLKRTRGGRVLVGASKAAYYSTVGLPATWTRAHRATSQLTEEMGQELGRQRRHYAGVAQTWAADSRAALRASIAPERRSYDAAFRPGRSGPGGSGGPDAGEAQLFAAAARPSPQVDWAAQGQGSADRFTASGPAWPPREERETPLAVAEADHALVEEMEQARRRRNETEDRTEGDEE
ncbi:hypothetical protein [Streptomyces sp. NPDC018584]|uniref:hypothetical protein n=1 Tax=unclassified Streptomyces TaxID=2593676 RepID=UPI0037AD0A82